jgi:phosphatidylinositol-3-phosphatase
MRRAIMLLGAVVLAGCAVAPGGALSLGMGRAGQGPPVPVVGDSRVTARLPAFSHVYVIVMENKEYSSIVGDRHAPYINRLIAQNGLATRYFAVTHPSEPNYLALFSGSTQGVRDDRIHRISAPNVADQLEAHGHSWAVFAENVPLGCYGRNSASGGPDGPGTYARRHEPAIMFRNISWNPTRCARISNFSHFSPAAADFELIVPNTCHDMHDCSVATGDAFLRRFVHRIKRGPDYATSVIFLTWDEGLSKRRGGGRVATVVIGPLVKHGFRSARRHTHYSILRTIENAWGLGCLAHTCKANDLREFFN